MNCRVAGVQTPAFVERLSATADPRPTPRGVAGVQTPAFVERSGATGARCASTRCVAGVQTPAFVERGSPRIRTRAPRSCRRSSDSGLR